MQNECINVLGGGQAKAGHRVRLSIPARRYRATRKSLNAALLDDTSDDKSSDDDFKWSAMQEDAEFIDSMVNDVVQDDESAECGDGPLVRAITFNSPGKTRMSLGTIAAEREKVQHMRQSAALDDEIENLDMTINSMEENFKTMFGEITYKRMVLEFEAKNGRKPRPVNYCEVIEGMPLRDMRYVDWATAIEDAIADHLK